MRAVGYARRSTEAQESSLSRQRESIVAYCDRQGYELTALIEETGSAWKPNQQPRLDVALGLILDGDADVLVVESHDRLTRRGPDYYRRNYSMFRIEVCESWDLAELRELLEVLR